MLAWNPVTQQEGWRIPGSSAGMLATGGGLVFKGNRDGISAFDASNGTELWTSIDTQTGIVAAPVTYSIDGKQYIAVVAGRSNSNYYAPDYSRLLVFRLGGNEQFPPAISYTPPELNPPASTASPEQIARGEDLYGDSCWLCHETPGNAGGMGRRGLFPDLILSPALDSPELLSAIVIDGIRSQNGMGSFANVVDAQGAEDIRAYLIERANITLQARSGQ
ncbi:MAG: hypothetical protein HOK55_04225 [Gammaproteobacteria bacterium]|nr:hypothetical protein [Gammaproteobacteria bacterium]